jgi:glycogen synthase
LRILLTTDVAGGVWTYTEELAAELSARGHAVELVSFGGDPRPEHIAWVERQPGIGFTPLPHPLEWMPEPEPALSASGAALRAVADRFRPDVIHLNQFYPAALELGAPKVVVAHSDVLSWWRAVHGRDAPVDGWFTRYRGWVEAGLHGAHARIAPTAWMAMRVEEVFRSPPVAVIANGRSADLFSSGAADREPMVVTVGRLWDEGKGAADLARAARSLQGSAHVLAAGPVRHPAGGSDFPTDSPGLEWLGTLRPDQLREILCRSAVYVATSRYEPFGLAPLEAALSGCALVMTDIPPFRELWEDAALFYPPGDPTALTDRVRSLLSDPGVRRSLAQTAGERARDRFSPRRMTDGYLALYLEILTGPRASPPWAGTAHP